MSRKRANKTQQKRKQQQPRRPKAKRLPAPNPALKLSACASKYAKVLEDPFSGATACVPALTNFPTMKHSVRIRGQFSTNPTTGVGMVTFNPFAAMFNTTGSVSPIYSTTATATTVTNFVTPQGSIATGVQGTNSNSPYLYTLGGDSVRCRLVAAGLRIKNVTALLNRGGALTGLETLSHTDLNGRSYGDVLNEDTCEIMNASYNGWTSVTYHPQDEDEFDFFAGSDIGSAVAPGPIFNWFMGFMAINTVQQDYDFEAYAVFEAKGKVVHGLTPSQSDPIGLSAVQNAVMPVEQRKPFITSSTIKAAGTVARAIAWLGQTYLSYRSRGAIPRPTPLLLTQSTGPIIEEIE